MTDIDNMPAAPLDQPAIDVFALQQQITALKDDLQRAREAAITRRAEHEADIERISSMLLAEAEQRDWCTQYDDFVEKLNNLLNIPLETRHRDYTAEIRVTVSYTAVPSQAQDMAGDIAYALYSYGDSLGSYEYAVTQTDVYDVNADD
jgi:hypothetical protein